LCCVHIGRMLEIGQQSHRISESNTLELQNKTRPVISYKSMRFSTQPQQGYLQETYAGDAQCPIQCNMTQAENRLGG
jgi:hypothetical protein